MEWAEWRDVPINEIRRDSGLYHVRIGHRPERIQPTAGPNSVLPSPESRTQR